LLVSLAEFDFDPFVLRFGTLVDFCAFGLRYVCKSAFFAHIAILGGFGRTCREKRIVLQVSDHLAQAFITSGRFVLAGGKVTRLGGE